MGDVCRDNSWERAKEKLPSFFREAENNGDVIVIVRGGIAELVSAPRNQKVHLIDLDCLNESEHERAEESGTNLEDIPPHWYLDQIDTVKGVKSFQENIYEGD